MPTFNEKFIEELKRKLNIVDVIGRYCALKKKGNVNYWACCPLPGHTEKTPSFSVNESGQYYHCFGCQKGGDVIKFIQEVESLSFYEAIKFLADMAKIPLPEEDDVDDEVIKRNKQKKDRLYSVLRDTALFYVNNLSKPEAKIYKDYLRSRGISDETIRKFGLGASTGYNQLPNYLKSKGYTEEEMLESGVCARNQRGNLYDFEAERLIVPIINQMGKVIAFGGRVLESKGFGKYKNTTQTTLFDKKRTLYAINNLKIEKNTTNLKYVIMVEGYMDTISLYQAGFKNVVASMGTSLTLDQAKLLKRYTDVVLVSYDGDSAGQGATIRSLDIFANEGFDVRIVKLTDGLDPDDVIRERGTDAYQKLLDQAVPLLDFKFELISNGKDMNSQVDKRKYVSESLNFLRGISDAFIREEFLKKVRDKSGITYESLKRDLESGTITESAREEIVIEKRALGDKIIQAERFILSALLNGCSYTNDFDVSEVYFNDEVRQAIADEYAFDFTDIQTLTSNLGESAYEELSHVLSAMDNLTDKTIEEKYFKDCVLALKKDNIDSDIKLLNAQYSAETDLNKRKELARAILKLTSKLNEINGG